MISEEILNRARSGIVAIGYIDSKWKDALNPEKSPQIEILGTGFFVSELSIITNRHVVEDLRDLDNQNKYLDRLWVWIVFGKSPMASAFLKIVHYSASNNPEFDVGFVNVGLKPSPDFDLVQDLHISEKADLQVGEPIAMCGYPYGSDMLRKKGEHYRFGPVLQHGHISALAPFHNSPDDVTEILLDVRAAEGMSGSPIFRPDDGTVIGILHSSWEATTALAIPLLRKRVDAWVDQHTKNMTQAKISHSPRYRERQQP